MSGENERHAFLRALAANEDDTTTRLVYADWLDENGEHEEADRMRKWDAAKKWLAGFAEWCGIEGGYVEMVRAGHEALTVGVYVFDGHNGGLNASNELCEDDARAEFWRNWQTVTGVAVPPEKVADENAFSCEC